MLTLFAIPKGFQGQFENIQLNAIRSWTRLDPRPEIILFGDDAGTARVAAELGLRHVPDVERNEYGTPRVDRLFAQARGLAASDLLCYVNADIILPPNFVRETDHTGGLTSGRPFLGVGRKTSLPITELIDFGDPDCDRNLRAWAARDGKHVTYDSDFFLFRRGMFEDMPPFAIGRCYWSSWFVFDTRRRGLDVVDMTSAVLTVEPRHDYSHATSTGGHARRSGVEYERNRRGFKGCWYDTTVNATSVLGETGLLPPPGRNRWLNYSVRFEYWVYFLLKARLYPYSLPLILLGRWGLAALRWFRSGLPRPRRLPA